MSSKTIWNGFYSTNNYSMPKDFKEPNCKIQYWYGDEEKKEREWDISFVKKFIRKLFLLKIKDKIMQNFSHYIQKNFVSN